MGAGGFHQDLSFRGKSLFTMVDTPFSQLQKEERMAEGWATGNAQTDNLGKRCTAERLIPPHQSWKMGPGRHEIP